jgi:hypothetical protein
MRTKLALALLTTALLGGLAPVAGAAVVRAECGFQTVAQETLTGGQDRFTGAAYGQLMSDDRATHTLRCYVTVDGVERASTPTATGTGVVVAAGRVTFDAPELAVVALCTEADGVTTLCRTEQDPCTDDCGPNPALIDLVNDAVAAFADPVVCPLLAALSPGVPGVADVTPDGDTTVVGVGLLWDCPPYGDLYPPSQP